MDIYWRPGCGYCNRLRDDLDRRGIEANWHNIWEDEEARQFVQQANRGSETVPTVAVGDQILTNPSGAQVVALMG